MNREDPEAVRVACTRFGHENWDAFAAAAWRYFERHGRGALLIDWASLDAWERGEAFLMDLPYATEVDGVEGIAALVQAYDPTVELVLVVTTDRQAVRAAPVAGESVITRLTAGETMCAWVLRRGITPPDAKEGQRSGR